MKDLGRGTLWCLLMLVSSGCTLVVGDDHTGDSELGGADAPASDAAAPDAASSDVPPSDTLQPDSSLPDAALPDAALPDTSQPDSCDLCGAGCCSEDETCLNEVCCPPEQVCEGACCAADEVCFTGFSCGQIGLDETIIFATELRHDGALGGRNGADSICAAEVPPRFSCSAVHALISVSATDEIVDMPENYGFDELKRLFFFNRTTGGFIRLANDWADALDSDIEVPPAQGLGISEDYWTGSANNGAVYPGADPWDYLCFGWTSNLESTVTSSYGGTGTYNSTSTWLFQSGKLQCYHEILLLCACAYAR